MVSVTLLAKPPHEGERWRTSHVAPAWPRVYALPYDFPIHERTCYGR